MHAAATFAITLAGAVAGLIIMFIVAVLIPGPQPWLWGAGFILGGFAALQWRKFH